MYAKAQAITIHNVNESIKLTEHDKTTEKMLVHCDSEQALYALELFGPVFLLNLH